MENKESLQRLKEYLLSQPPEVVATICSGLMLDIHRYANFSQLSKHEVNSLVGRTLKNSEQVQNFIKNGPSGDIVVRKYNSETGKYG